MFKKLSILAGIVAIAGMAFAAFAPSASAEEPQRLLVGRGVLDAHGSGLVAVKGKMDYYARADGGILLVKDIAGDAEINVTGDGDTAEFHGFTAYFGINGRAHITGSDVAVIVVGKDIDLHVVGKGWAFLKGRGTFEVNNRGPFQHIGCRAPAAIVPTHVAAAGRP